MGEGRTSFFVTNPSEQPFFCTSARTRPWPWLGNVGSLQLTGRLCCVYMRRSSGLDETGIIIDETCMCFILKKGQVLSRTTYEAGINNNDNNCARVDAGSFGEKTRDRVRYSTLFDGGRRRERTGGMRAMGKEKMRRRERRVPEREAREGL